MVSCLLFYKCIVTLGNQTIGKTEQGIRNEADIRDK